MDRAQIISYYQNKRDNHECVHFECQRPAQDYADGARAPECRYLCTNHQWYLSHLCEGYHLTYNPDHYGEDIEHLITDEIAQRKNFQIIFGMETDYNHQEWIYFLKLTRKEMSKTCGICDSTYYPKLHEHAIRKKGYKSILDLYYSSGFRRCIHCEQFYPSTHHLITELWYNDEDNYRQSQDDEEMQDQEWRIEEEEI